MAEEEVLYFGYGSNLDVSDWKSWCERKHLPYDGLVEISPCWLPNYTMKFHYFSSSRDGGAADIVENGRGHAVPGVLFSMDQDALAAMDQKEGTQAGVYARRMVHVALPDGTFVEALTYCVTPPRREDKFIQPTKQYIGLIEKGLKKRNLPIGELKNAIEDFSPSFPVEKIFVYGTLMEGEVRSSTTKQLCNGEARSASISGELADLGAFPGLIAGDGTVKGELYHLDQVYSALQTLDSIEGFYGYGSDDSLYIRTIVEVQTDEGTEWAWTYMYNEQNGSLNPMIDSGDWRVR